MYQCTTHQPDKISVPVCQNQRASGQNTMCPRSDPMHAFFPVPCRWPGSPSTRARRSLHCGPRPSRLALLGRLVQKGQSGQRIEQSHRRGPLTWQDLCTQQAHITLQGHHNHHSACNSHRRRYQKGRTCSTGRDNARRASPAPTRTRIIFAHPTCLLARSSLGPSPCRHHHQGPSRQ